MNLVIDEAVEKTKEGQQNAIGMVVSIVIDYILFFYLVSTFSFGNSVLEFLGFGIIM
ncbi:unnamed protein product [Larinioides sclopetarius]|uniref:Uncharacterized protein n=1 Tax=Larinioides sclopetarius TaxID=280406 RepID=A0AAV2A202_9ARAC